MQHFLMSAVFFSVLLLLDLLLQLHHLMEIFVLLLYVLYVCEQRQRGEEKKIYMCIPHL